MQEWRRRKIWHFSMPDGIGLVEGRLILGAQVSPSGRLQISRAGGQPGSKSVDITSERAPWTRAYLLYENMNSLFQDDELCS